MSRHEFSKPTKREALKRSGGKCEAQGARYGLPDGMRCNADLSYGVEFDHCIPDGLGGDTDLEQCLCACPKCHRWKTSHIDVPQIAKMKRQRDKHSGITKSGRPMMGSRASGWKKKMDGTTVRRDGGPND